LSLKLFFKEYPKGAFGPNITMNQFKEAFELKEIQVPEKVMNYMIRSLFAISNDLSSLDKYKLFELFPINTQYNTAESFFKEEI